MLQPKACLLTTSIVHYKVGMTTMATTLVMAIVNFMSSATLVILPIVSERSWSTLEHVEVLLDIVAVHLGLSLPKSFWEFRGC